MVNQAEDTQGEFMHQGKLRRPKILVIDSPTFFEMQERIHFSLTEQHPDCVFENRPYKAPQKEFRLGGSPESSLDAEMKRMADYICDPKNKVAAVLTAYGNPAYGPLLCEIVKARGYKGLVALHMGDMPSSLETETAKKAGAIGAYDRSALASENPKYSAVAALKQALGQQRVIE